MKTLSEYRSEYAIRYVERENGRIGIACDECGHELKGENVLLLTHPPQRNIWCDKCGYKGRVFV